MYQLCFRFVVEAAIHKNIGSINHLGHHFIAATDSTITGDIYVWLGMNPLKAKKPKFVDFPKKVLDVQLAEKLWLQSEKLTGVVYDL